MVDSKRKPGRPRRSDHASDVRVWVLLTRAEKRLLRRAAQAAGISMGAFVRDALSKKLNDLDS